MAAAELLPLFPLELVLLPGELIPLHIFEERYRLMVGRAHDEQSEFGIVHASDGKVSSIGCAARVETVTKRYEDGRFDIMARGGRRFQAVEFDNSEDFLQAKVDFFEDEHPIGDPDRIEAALAAAEQLAMAANTSVKNRIDHAAPVSFQIAALIPTETNLKQQMLLRRSENQRLKLLIQYLEQLTVKVLRTEKSRRVASSNGHSTGSGTG